jgi:hypothetical protein
VACVGYGDFNGLSAELWEAAREQMRVCDESVWTLRARGTETCCSVYVYNEKGNFEVYFEPRVRELAYTSMTMSRWRQSGVITRYEKTVKWTGLCEEEEEEVAGNRRWVLPMNVPTSALSCVNYEARRTEKRWRAAPLQELGREMLMKISSFSDP